MARMTDHEQDGPLGAAFDRLRPTLAIAGSTERFPVRRVFCVGRNYADHVAEMGGDPKAEPPVFFMKPADSAFTAAEGVPGGAAGVAPFPPATSKLHYEVELVVAIGASGRDVEVDDADALVWGLGVGIDLTRRDLQDEAKAAGRPWDMSKGFDWSAPMSELLPAAQAPGTTTGRIRLSVDGEPRQDGDLSQQIWSVREILAKLTQLVELRAGDLVMTGTPAGVGAVVAGSRIDAEIEGVGSLRVELG